MKKSHVLLTMVGLLALTGCNKPVMGARTYVPAKDEKAIDASRQYNDFGSDQAVGEVPAASNLPESQPAPAAPVYSAPADAPAAAPAPAPARSAYAPMESIPSSKGITSDSKSARKGGKKAGRKASAGKTVSAKGGIYIVKAGDFPARIARRLNVSVRDLLEVNNMTMADAKKLRVGQKLTIPGKSSPKAGKGQPAGKNSAAVQVEAGIYVVRAGDFPQRIARRLKVKLADLLKANNLTMENSRNLQIGQKLVVPGSKAAAAAPKAAVKAAVKAEEPAGKENAPQKDNAALEAADNVAEKLEQNAPESGKKPEAAAPVDDNATEPYELPEDTTFKKLAEKFNTTEEHMRRINLEVSGDEALTKGKCILVPPQK